MMILAIDTSGPNCAVCLAEAMAGGGVTLRSQREERIGRGHAERLVPMVVEALADAGLGFRDVGRIAVAVGPGSFTGVRVGVAAARGLALALAIEAVGVGSLEALAAEAGDAAAAPVVVAALAGPRGELFALAQEAGGVRLEPSLIAAADLARQVAGWRREPVALIGSGAPAAAEALAGRGLDARLVREAEAPAVGWIARLALAGQGASPPRPLYLRPPDARPQSGQAIARA